MSKNIVCWSNPQTCADVSRKWLRGKSHFLRRKIEMMKQFILYMGICGLLLDMASCRDESAALPTGSLYLGVEEDATILTRATTEVTDELLRVDIIDAAGDTLKSYDDYYTEVRGQRIVLPVGSYTVAVRSNLSGGAAWETPFYAGSESVTVQAGEITSAQVVCQITNTKVMVEYAPSLSQYFSNYETTVSNTSGSLLYTRDEYRAGYFAPEKLTAELHLTNLDGNTFTLTRVYPDIQPRYAYKLRYYLDEGDGGEDDSGDAGADFGGIGVDEQADTIYYNISIKEEELFGKGAPTLTLTGFSDEGKLTFKKTDNPDVPEHAIQISAPNGVKQFRVDAVSHQFAGMESFDLCSLSTSERAHLQALNFPLPDDMTAKEMTLELTEFAKGLELTSETEITTHTFTCTVLDSLHQETVMTFAYELRPDVAAYVVEPVSWTTFALLKGNCVDETAYFLIQPAGGTEKAIKTVTRDAEGNISALVMGLEAGVSYSYWLVSDENADMSCEPVTFTLATPYEVPNMGFDSWTNQTKGSINVPIFGGEKTYISPNSDANNVYWESGNLGAAVASKTLTNETAETALSTSTKAASLSSQFANVAGIGAFAAGSVYSGYPTNVTSSGAHLMYGRPYQGFPVYLRGYYKYTPGTINYRDGKEVSDEELDQCIIQIALSTKQHEVISTTSEVKTYPFDDESVFAYGTYVSGTTEDLTGEVHTEEIQNGYAPFKVRLNYKTATPPDGPFYILIMASSSRYGDYFTGSTSSVMYVDEFSLDYNYDAEAFSGTTLGNMTPVNIND